MLDTFVLEQSYSLLIYKFIHIPFTYVLVDSFSHSQYNHDPIYTSGEESIGDFLDDDESSEEETRPKERFRQKVGYFISVQFPCIFNSTNFG